MSPVLRPATSADLPAINAIYNHYVLSCTCTYQTVPSTAEEREDWFGKHGEKHPVIVAEHEGAVIGWGSLSKLHERQAFARSVEDSVYIHHAHHGRGLGKMLLTELLRLAADRGHHTVLAAISGDQERSLRLHAAFGFVEAGRIREAGYKFDRWLDVVWMQKMI
jgi:phosphinothricin acetyltransferase